MYKKYLFIYFYALLSILSEKCFSLEIRNDLGQGASIGVHTMPHNNAFPPGGRIYINAGETQDFQLPPEDITGMKALLRNGDYYTVSLSAHTSGWQPLGECQLAIRIGNEAELDRFFARGHVSMAVNTNGNGLQCQFNYIG